MQDPRTMIAVIDELEAMHRSLGEIVRTERDGWRLELVQRRRALSELLGRLTQLLDKTSERDDLSTSDRIDLRSKLASFRTALAMHQANYPAVTISQGDTAYLTSAQQAQAASAEFCRRVRQVFNPG